MHVQLPDADALSAEFLRIIRDELSDANLAEIDRRNADETNASICHSHDFCDPNQTMIDALATFGVEVDPHDAAHMSLWDESWGIAKAAGFYDVADDDSRANGRK